MRRFLSLLAMPVLIVALVWLGAVIYLQQTQLEVTGTTLILGFIVAPLAFVLTWFGIKAIAKAIANKPSADSQAQAKQQDPAPQNEEQKPLLAVLASAAHTLQGDDIEGLLAGIKQSELRPELSPRLIDQDGLPVMCALSEALEIDAFSTFMQHWLVSATPEHPAQNTPEQGYRLLALLEAPVRKILDQLEDMLPATPESEAQRAAVKRPVLVKLFIKTGWEDFVEAWLRPQFAPLNAFNMGFIRPDPAQAALQSDALRVSSAFSRDLKSIPPDSLLLLIGCDSFGTEACLQKIEASGQLFSSSHQQGLIPGEAAACVLLGAADKVSDGLEPLALMYPSRWAARKKPVEANGRTDITTLESLLTGLLEPHATPADTISGLISDCDQRSAWNTEAASFVSACFPALDPIADHLALGRALGTTGEASSTLALACAAACVREQAKSVITASLKDSTQRSLALLCPWPETTS